MIIRPALTDDMPKLISMGERFFETTPLTKFYTLDRASLEVLINSMIASDQFIAVACEGDDVIGCLGAIIVPAPFNMNVTQLHEMFWWVEPEYRASGAGIELKSCMQKWAAASGASLLCMVAIEGPRTEAVRKVYKKHGYVELEHTFMKGV